MVRVNKALAKLSSNSMRESRAWKKHFKEFLILTSKSSVEEGEPEDLGEKHPLIFLADVIEVVTLFSVRAPGVDKIWGYDKALDIVRMPS